ncbi:MAG: hypothetical protein ACLUD2_12835 [Clostridium sp.]
MEVNIVKLDMGLVSGIDRNRDKRELAMKPDPAATARDILCTRRGCGADRESYHAFSTRS